MDAYAKRTGRDAGHVFTVGDADTILARVAEYVDAGVSKFILRPLGDGDDAIFGTGGNDSLYGQLGTDYLHGGSNTDTTDNESLDTRISVEILA